MRREFDADKLPSRWVRGFEGRYRVNVEGTVWRVNLKGRPAEMTPYRCGNGDGLHVLRLTKPGGFPRVARYVHRIVWEAFNGEIPAGECVTHVNGLTMDNRLCNLKLMTKREAARTRNSKHGKRVVRYDEKGCETGWYPSIEAAARENHMHERSVRDRCNGKIRYPFMRGYVTFKYARDI